MQTKQFALWQDFRFMNSGLPVQAQGFQDPSYDFVYLGGHKDGDYIVTHARTVTYGPGGHLSFGIGIVKLKQTAPYYELKFSEPMPDSISSVASYQGKCLASFHGKTAGWYNYEAVSDPFAGVSLFNDYYHFTDLTPEQSIKSSLVTPAHSQFWHVGGDPNGKNGFIIKNRVIVQRSQSSALNMIIDLSNGDVDGMLAIGNNGKIYSTRTDLAQAIPDAVIGWEKADNFSAYPNPFNSELTIKSSSEAIVTLSDVLGTVIKQIRVEPGDNRISLVGLKQGIYFLTNKKQTLKLIKQ
jgi:hypothetical protein